MTSVLITGTSSGIGRATALRLARRPELTVYATARTPDAIRDLGFGATAAGTLSHSAAPSGPYAALNTAIDKQMAATYESKLLAAAPDTVAKVIERAVTARRPRTRYIVTPAARMLVHTRRLLGARVFDAYLRMQFRPAA